MDAITPVEPESKETTSFSIRLTERQRELLARAAELRGWTMTNLIKQAAIDRAAHIINTSDVNRVDFKDIAREIATQVFAKRSLRTLGASGYQEVLVAVGDISSVPLESATDYVEVWPWNMPSEFLSQLEEAARYGGVEFLNELVTACNELLKRSNPRDLPEPVDPNSL